MKEEKNIHRLEWIDSVKGFGIILVVIGHHLQGLQSVVDWICCFHMPLFFILSGYLFAYKNNRYQSIKSFVLSKIRSIMYPYFIWSLLIILWHFIFYDIIFTQTSSDFSTLEVALFSVSTYGYHALWFLPCLFFSSVFFYVLCKNKLLHIICPLLGVAVLFINFFPIKNYAVNYIYRVLVATVFIYFGYLFFYLLNKKSIKILLLCIGAVLSVLSFVLPLVFSSYFPSVNIACRSIGNPFAFYTFALSNCIVTIIIFQKFPLLNNFFGFWGKNSILVMAIHMDMTIETAWLLFSRLPVSFGITIDSIIVIIIEFIILFILILLINKFCPFLYKCPIPIKKGTTNE